MLIKKVLISILLSGLFLVFVPTNAIADSSSEVQIRFQLLTQIQQLLKEVVRLQSILNSQLGESASFISNTKYVPYKTVLFSLPFESVYKIDDGKLSKIDGYGEVRNVDKQIFNLFLSVLGKEYVSKYIQEWRIFYDNESDLGAFVEVTEDTEKWVIGVNREGYIYDDNQVIVSYSNLFIHEFAHIKLFKKADFVKKFTESFWTREDMLNKKSVAEAISVNDKLKTMLKYYDKNRNQFVSDYATISPEEDIAETFVSFIRESKPKGVTIREQKILFFYQDLDFVKLRLELRSNLFKISSL